MPGPGYHTPATVPVLWQGHVWVHGGGVGGWGWRGGLRVGLGVERWGLGVEGWAEGAAGGGVLGAGGTNLCSDKHM